MKIICAQCGGKSEKPTGSVNRAKKDGLRIFCNRKCAGLGRRHNKTKAQLVEKKRLYDEEYRQKNVGMLKEKKRLYFQRTYDSAKAAEKRKERMPSHVEYCRQPEYRQWKKVYDRQYLAKKKHGEFWESILILRDIETEVTTRMPKQEIRALNGTLNKWIQRRRAYESSISNRT